MIYKFFGGVTQVGWSCLLILSLVEGCVIIMSPIPPAVYPMLVFPSQTTIVILWGLYSVFKKFVMKYENNKFSNRLSIYSCLQVMSYYRNYASLELFYYLLPITTVAYFAGYGGVQSFELLYISLIDFGIGSFLFTGFLVGLGIVSVLSGNTPR